MIREILHELEQAINKRDESLGSQVLPEDFPSYYLGVKTGLVEAYYIVKEYEREED